MSCLLLLYVHAQDLNAGNIPGIAEARELYQADLVQMIIEANEYCGYVLQQNSALQSLSQQSTYTLLCTATLRIEASTRWTVYCQL
jgi:hypothetical protein